ncbi:MAG: Large-conductance mechanosensitive channel, MscL, partial [Ilumatobacteraceae bacterium]
MKNFLKEFKDFIATGNIVELAVAFILGLAI